MNLAEIFYDQMNSRRKLPFNLSDALLILFLHDLEKPWKYSKEAQYENELKSYPTYKDFLHAKVKEFNFVLTPEHLNALKYIHGEGDDYHPTERIQ